MVRPGMHLVYNRLPYMARQIGPAADEASRQSAERMRDAIRASVRVDTGELRDSIMVSTAPGGYAVTSEADQALSEEFGTSRQSDHPTFGPAAEHERPAFPRGLADSLQRRLR